MSSVIMDVPIDQLRALPLEKRLEIIEALWESVESEAGPFPISDEILEEADREFEAHLADPSSSIPWEVVRARLRERYG
jgi:putative addiction module component (TIGR02574 family)